jgi:hypothetical protein
MEIIFSMKAQVALFADPQSRQEALALALLSAAALVLPSMDQCTRGPSITAMVLTHLHWFL